MRIFVTGGTGYIGAHLVRELLAREHEVTVLSREPARLETSLGALAPGGRLRVTAGELRQGVDPHALGGHDACVHAAIVWDDISPTPDVDEVAASRGLFEAAARAHIPRMVFVSSVAVHRPFARRMSELDRIAPADEYGRAKAASEAALAELAAETGVQARVVRPGPTVGAPALPGARFRSDRRIAELVRFARAGADLHVTRGEARQLTPVDGLARTIRLLVEAESAPDLVVCVAREATSWESIARLAIEKTGSASDLVVAAGSDEPAPRFDTARLEHLLGGPLDASQALDAHLDALAHGLEPVP